MLKIMLCKHCNKEKPIVAKASCHNCYRKYEANMGMCINCKEPKRIIAKGLCYNCYQSTGKIYTNIKNRNSKLYFGHDLLELKEVKEKCIICGFDKVIHIHHLDKNNKNNSISNFIGLCPNHHKLIHMKKWHVETLNQIIEKQKEALALL